MGNEVIDLFHEGGRSSLSMHSHIDVEKPALSPNGKKENHPMKSILSKPEPLVEGMVVQQPRSVSFQDTVTFLEIRPRLFIGVDEIRDVWYNDEEYSKIKKIVKETVKKSEKGEPIEEAKGVTMRGLEGRTKFGSRRRKNNKAAALEAVWKTQIDLWKNKSNHPATIAAAYRPHSTHAILFARQSAHADALYVSQHVRLEVELQ